MTIARGERHGSAKLTWADVHEIRALYRERFGSYRWLADRYGISYQQVLRIVKRQHWVKR